MLVLTNKRSLLGFAVIVIALLVNTTELWSQRTVATFSGVVVDASGGIIPGVEIDLTNQNTGAHITGQTNASGDFVFNYVPVGVYTLTITTPGFKTHTESDIAVAAAQNVRRRFALEIGVQTETVTVSTDAPLTNTVSVEQRANFDTNEISSMPLSNRNVSNLLSVSTGLTRDAGTAGSGGGRVRLNGLGGSSVRVTANGTDASGNAGAPGLSQYLQFNKIDVMSIEAVGEVQVVKGVVPAEYGPAMGGNINLITKSGTNDWHGSLFHRYEGAALDARHQFLKEKGQAVWNQYGGSFGGPIVKDRVFFFGAYEGYQESVPRALNGNVPTPKFREMMLDALPFPETQINLDALPLPTDAYGPDDLLGVFRGSRPQTSKDDHYDSRLDVSIFGGNLSATYTRGHPFFRQPRVSPVNSRVFNSRTERFNTNYVIGRGSWTSETRFGYNKNYLARLDEALLIKDPTQEETIPYYRRVTGLTFTGMENINGAELHQRGLAPTLSFEQQIAVIHGDHSLKFGGLYMRPAGGRPDVDTGRVRFQTLDELLSNRPTDVRVTFGVNENIWRMTQFGFFLQDDWRASQKLVLNVGLRWDYFGKAVTKPTDPDFPAGFYNRDGLLDADFHFGDLRDPLDPYESDAMNIAPRFGFAYNVDGNGKTVIRGGFGVMFQSLDPQMFETAFSNTAVVPFRSTFSATEAAELGLKFPVYIEDVLPIVAGQNQTGSNDVTDPNIEAPYAMNFSLGIQRAITPSMVLETSFVGSRGVKFVLTRTYNAISRLTGIRPNPALGEALYNDNSQQSSYYSWQTSLKKRLSRNLQYSLNYTYGKGMSPAGGDISRSFNGDTTQNVQDFFNIDAERGPSAGDVTHQFVGSALYNIPVPNFVQNSRVGRVILGGWEMTGIFKANTGEPFDVTQSSSSPASRPDVVGSNPTNDECCGFGSLQYLDRSQFQPVPLGPGGTTIHRGNIGHNALRGPGLWNLDFSMAKNIRFSAERFNLELRADLLNALNHTNYVGLSTSINSNTFGQVTDTRGPRTIQLQTRFTF